MRVTINLIICVFAVQMTVGCGASLTEQCRKLKMASYGGEIYKQMKKETDPIKKRKLFGESWAEKARNVNNLDLSNPALKSIQKRLVKDREGWAKRSQGYNESLEDYKKFRQESDDLEQEIDAVCSQK